MKSNVYLSNECKRFRKMEEVASTERKESDDELDHEVEFIK